MSIMHTTACGTQPYDQTYSLGYEVGHADWSPFPRVNHLRQTFLDRPYDIDGSQANERNSFQTSGLFCLAKRI